MTHQAAAPSLDVGTGFTLSETPHGHLHREGVVDETDLSKLETEVMLKELEMFVKRLDDAQLDKLQDILDEEGYDEATQAEELLKELKDMGMEDGDIADLNILVDDMTSFLNLIPMLSTKLDLGHKDLSDNVKLYLLGLPNKVGPLGFLALHSTLNSDVLEEEVEQSSHRQRRGSRGQRYPEEIRRCFRAARQECLSSSSPGNRNYFVVWEQSFSDSDKRSLWDYCNCRQHHYIDHNNRGIVEQSCCCPRLVEEKSDPSVDSIASVTASFILCQSCPACCRDRFF